MLKDLDKLTAAFILSAINSGCCGLRHPDKLRELQKGQLEAFIAGQTPSPLKEIIREYTILEQGLQDTTPRDYFYLGHYDAVRKEIEEVFGMDFDEVISQNRTALNHAQNCPVQFYEIGEKPYNSQQGTIIGMNLFDGENQLLKIIQGLEIPQPGEIVSAHWGHLLETVDDDNYSQLDQALKLMQDHYLLIQLALKPK